MNQGKITGYYQRSTGSIPVARSRFTHINTGHFLGLLKKESEVLKKVTQQASWRA